MSSEQGCETQPQAVIHNTFLALTFYIIMKDAGIKMSSIIQNIVGKAQEIDTAAMEKPLCCLSVYIERKPAGHRKLVQ